MENQSFSFSEFLSSPVFTKILGQLAQAVSPNSGGAMLGQFGSNMAESQTIAKEQEKQKAALENVLRTMMSVGAVTKPGDTGTNVGKENARVSSNMQPVDLFTSLLGTLLNPQSGLSSFEAAALSPGQAMELGKQSKESQLTGIATVMNLMNLHDALKTGDTQRALMEANAAHSYAAAAKDLFEMKEREKERDYINIGIDKKGKNVFKDTRTGEVFTGEMSPYAMNDGGDTIKTNAQVDNIARRYAFEDLYNVALVFKGLSAEENPLENFLNTESGNGELKESAEMWLFSKLPENYRTFYKQLRDFYVEGQMMGKSPATLSLLANELVQDFISQNPPEGNTMISTSEDIMPSMQDVYRTGNLPNIPGKEPAALVPAMPTVKEKFTYGKAK